MKTSGFDFICWFDGAVEPTNPGGHMGMGAFVKCAKSGNTMFKHSAYRAPDKNNTNNKAEYGGLYYVLKFLIDNDYHKTKRVLIHGDSQMVCNQMIGKWGINDGKPYTDGARICLEMVSKFNDRVVFDWVPREKNTVADGLSKKGLQSRGIFESAYRRKNK